MKKYLLYILGEFWKRKSRILQKVALQFLMISWSKFWRKSSKHTLKKKTLEEFQGEFVEQSLEEFL